MSVFTRGTVSFQYPANWTLDTEDDGAAWTASAFSPDTAFALVALRPDADTPAELADETLKALKGEYQDLDSEPVVESVGGQPAVGYDVDFLSVDVAIMCLIRAVDTPDGPLLFLAQVGEFDREAHEPLLRAVLQSVQIADE
jgi:hypothetical protein